MTPWVTRLILANIAAYLITARSPVLFHELMLFPTPALVAHRPWTLLTYMFLHGGLGHIFFNMIALFFFGPPVEARLGSRDFMLLYLLSGLGGAILSLLLMPMAPVVGASGAIFGVMLGYARYWPTAQVYIMGVLPVPARVLVIGLAALSLFSGFSGMGAPIAHFAHLGGFAGGWLFLHWRDRRGRHTRLEPRRNATLERIAGRARQEEARWRAIELDKLHEVNRAEVERVLRKLDEFGAPSLSPDERAFLDRMSTSTRS
ncbi:MAG TPA: rhomboid family intramembrane serine protease [Longimicrobiales bacterium]